MRNPLVSAVIPVWNRAEFVGQAVESALAQTVADLEVVVVDDGSTDRTASAVEAIADPRVRLVRKEHSGIAATRNRGVAESRGTYLAFLDSDDVWVGDKLEKQLPLFRPGTGFVYGRYRSERDGTPLRSKPVGGPSGRIYHRLLARIFVQMSTAVVTREAAQDVGPFDEGFAYADEYDWFLRLARRFDCGFVDEDVVVYRIHGGNESAKAELRNTENLEVYRRALASAGSDSKARRIARRRIAVFAGQLGDMKTSQGDAPAALKAYSEAVAARPWSLRLRLKAASARRVMRLEA